MQAAARDEEKRLKVTVSWINLIRVDCNFMMPPPRLLSLDRLGAFCTTKLPQKRDRIESDKLGKGKKQRILITQTTIKPSRFVTFLIYFACLRSLTLPRRARLDEGKIKFNYMFERSTISVMQNQKTTKVDEKKSTAK